MQLCHYATAPPSMVWGSFLRETIIDGSCCGIASVTPTLRSGHASRRVHGSGIRDSGFVIQVVGMGFPVYISGRKRMDGVWDWIWLHDSRFCLGGEVSA